MCGRITQLFTWRELVELYGLLDQPARNLEPRSNIAPTTTVDVVVEAEQGRRVVPARWGLIPDWWRKPLSDLPATHNARAEGLAERPMFRTAFRHHRCVVPASGWYEWTGPAKARLPWYIAARDGGPLSLAGLWARWTSPEGEAVVSVTIITCAASPWMAEIHDRMPAVLPAAAVDAWLAAPDPALLRPVGAELLRAFRVDPRVNSARYQGEDATWPIGGALFAP